jgi:hypothetical protein
MSTRVRRSLVMGAVMVGMLATGVVSASPASAATAATKCQTAWGSLPQADPTLTGAVMLDTRTGRHDCFDRVVFDVAGQADGYRVEYVDRIPTEPSGIPLPVAGGAVLRVTLNVSIIDPVTGEWVYDHDTTSVNDVTGYKTLRDVVFGGGHNPADGEYYTTFGVGVRARLPFRVFVLDGPGSGSRIVLDVAHRW